MPPRPPAELTLADVIASSASTGERARSLLEVLRPTVGFDGAWLALVDPDRPGYRTAADLDLSEATVDFLAGPTTARDIEITGTDTACPPLSPSDLPYPAEELSTWADCLMPVGVFEALAVGLFAPDGRHVGFMALLSGDHRPPTSAARRELHRLAPLVAQGIDPMRSLVAAARLVRGAVAGLVLHDDGRSEPLPGLPSHAMVTPDSALLGVCHDRLVSPRPFSSFLWPVAGGRGLSSRHLQVTVLAVPDDLTTRTRAVVVLSPPPDLRGLTPRELEVLGLLVEGCTNPEIARTLVVAPRTVAAHLEHVLAKLDAPSRTLAAVRAERDGLYVPSASLRSSGAGGVAVEPRGGEGGRPPSPGGSRLEPIPPRNSDICGVLDRRGTILSVNDAWGDFAPTSPPAGGGVGADYVEVCRVAERAGAPGASNVLRSLDAVLSGHRASSWTVYPCALPGELRWFQVGFTATGRSGHVLVRHVDITDRMSPADPAFAGILDDDEGTLTEAGLLLALDEWITGPTRDAVVVMLADRGPVPARARALARIVGLVAGDLLAVVVSASDPAAARRVVDAVVATTPGPTTAGRPRWSVVERADTDDGAALLDRARAHRREDLVSC